MSPKQVHEDSTRLLDALNFSEELAELEREHEDEIRRLLLSVIEVMDSFDRVLASYDIEASKMPEWLCAVRLIAHQLERVLEKAAVVPIGCKGEIVDPVRHEVAEIRSVSSVVNDTIIEVLSRGYERHGEVLRRPRVVVAFQEDTNR